MRAIVFGCLMIMLMGAAGEAMARTADQTARRSARIRGYSPEQTSCFVKVFRTYASLNSRGRWVAGGRSRRADIYRHEAWSRCGVLR